MDHPELRELLLELYSGRVPTPAARKDFEGRELVVSPFDGHYGLAGWIIAVNGSPPRGVVVSLETRERRYMPASVFYLEMDKSRRLGAAQASIVRKFIEQIPPASAVRNASAAASSGAREQAAAISLTNGADAGGLLHEAAMLLAQCCGPDHWGKSEQLRTRTLAWLDKHGLIPSPLR